jgi:hypothetical protein
VSTDPKQSSCALFPPGVVGLLNGKTDKVTPILIDREGGPAMTHSQSSQGTNCLHSRSIIVLLIIILGLVTVSGAATYTVDRLDDPAFVSLTPCASITIEDCSLRAAINKANANPGVNTVVLPAGHTYVLERNATDPDTAASGGLDSASSDIEGGGGLCVTDQYDSLQIDIGNSKIANNATAELGGAIYVSSYGGYAALTSVTISDNQSDRRY